MTTMRDGGAGVPRFEEETREGSMKQDIKYHIEADHYLEKTETSALCGGMLEVRVPAEGGGEARIYTTQGPGGYPLVGVAIGAVTGQAVACRWTADGEPEGGDRAWRRVWQLKRPAPGWSVKGDAVSVAPSVIGIDAGIKAAALRWLDWMRTNAGSSDVREHVVALQLLLSEPRLPAEPTQAIMMAITSSGSVGQIYQAIRTAAMLPATREVDVWRVEWALASERGGWHPMADVHASKEDADKFADYLRSTEGRQVMKITGPHRQEVPAT